MLTDAVRAGSEVWRAAVRQTVPSIRAMQFLRASPLSSSDSLQPGHNKMLDRWSCSLSCYGLASGIRERDKASQSLDE